MVDASRIEERAVVVGSDGAHAGTVDLVDASGIKPARTDAEEVERKWSTS